VSAQRVSQHADRGGGSTCADVHNVTLSEDIKNWMNFTNELCYLVLTVMLTDCSWHLWMLTELFHASTVVLSRPTVFCILCGSLTIRLTVYSRI